MFNTRLAFCAAAGYIDLDDVHPVKGESLAVARAWTKPIGLLNIDALHTYEACRADIDAWSRYLVPGGVLIVHDYFDKKFGVRKACDERLTRANGWEVLERVRWEFRPKRRGQIIARKVR